MKEFHPKQLKKLTGTLPKVGLNVDNFELWMTNVRCWVDGKNPIMDFDLWVLGLSSPMKNKKKFFWLLYKEMPFFEILHVNIHKSIKLIFSAQSSFQFQAFEFLSGSSVVLFPANINKKVLVYSLLDEYFTLLSLLLSLKYFLLLHILKMI